MKKSIGDNMIPKDWGLEKGLDLIKKSGYDGVELWLGGNSWFDMKTTDAQVNELYRKVANAGLAVSDVANTLDWDEPISARDPRIRERAVRHSERQLETAQLLKTDAILVVAGVVTEEVPYNEVYGRCLETVKSMGDHAAKARVKIGCENCNSEQRFLITPREFWQFLNEVNNPSSGVWADFDRAP